MKNVSNPQESERPADTEGVCYADDEGSGSEISDSSDLVPMSVALRLLDEVRPLLHFRVHREHSPSLTASGESDGWTDSSHFLWAMCATLADGDADPEWTLAFEKWRFQWKRIQKQVKSYGYTHFSSVIPPAPVNLATVRFLASQPREFEIEQQDPDGVSDHQDIWTLWRNIIEVPADQVTDIEVCLKDTGKLVGSQ
ncbi:hypothetical protein N7457_000801 [Penicillium paradoxum]|uniref:uncharacterized protein n=1 Tax=Penicillium paradoxum TaxID=176176 RepID=UPI0025467326|nr:uncharacterized protein N7457_000801 [Penicillium paradoxum]KAJ5794202.1 hypothetical protein N7457_000801 [Penicillium paradoxum]